MVVHEPGEWFDETLRTLAAQDYPNLRALFLLTPAPEAEIADLTARIRRVLPAAFVRQLASNSGFGPSVNEVLRLVEGDNGFFLLCHDDIALEPRTVRILVAELFRSNAGIVGPKLVDWEQPRLLQYVGLGLDRFGEVDPFVEPGEVDQEQHDAVRDVFVIPSACMLAWAGTTRRSRSTVTMSTCAGGRTSPVPASSLPPMPGCATASSCSSAGPISRTARSPAATACARSQRSPARRACSVVRCNWCW
jgi:hypothetical protein